MGSGSLAAQDTLVNSWLLLLAMGELVVGSIEPMPWSLHQGLRKLGVYSLTLVVYGLNVVSTDIIIIIC